jgi:tetratricopeptide (TPR) repeat protein
MLAAVFLFDNLAVQGVDGQQQQPPPRLPSEMAERWGVSLETLARVEELGRQVDAVYQEWVRSRDRGALEQAVKLQTAVVELAPKSAEMRASLATLYYYQGDDARAEVHARQAVQLNPNSPSSQKLLGRVLVQVGRSEEGLPHLQKALSLVPQDGECWYKTGTVFFEQAEFLISQCPSLICIHTN